MQALVHIAVQLLKSTIVKSLDSLVQSAIAGVLWYSRLVVQVHTGATHTASFEQQLS